jgi:hypothetical protein
VAAARGHDTAPCQPHPGPAHALAARSTAFYRVVAVEPDEIAPWIDELRHRIERDDLADLSPIDLDTFSVPAELVACTMLAELDDIDALPVAERDRPDLIARRRTLVWDFVWLQEQIG